jgi:transposase
MLYGGGMGVRVSASEARELERIVREGRGEARLYRRARMVQLAARGASITSIARAMGTNRARVGEWLRRFEEEGVEGLGDEPRSGRPVEVTALERHQVIAAACSKPSDFGLDRAVWSHEALAEALEESGRVRSISSSTVGRILAEAEIKPHRVKAWCHSTDPEYQAKMQAIVSLYVSPPKGESVLSVDEKSGIQVLSRRRAMVPASPGRAARQEFEYRRHGTRCLFACFNVRTGQVLGRCTLQRTRDDFFSFMDLAAQRYRQGRVHVVLDNLNTHKDTSRGAFLTEWNRSHGERFHFHYTPTHGSWLNQVELWFSILSRRVLRHGEFATPDAMVTTIERFIERWNRHEARPFRWTYEGRPLVSA